MVGLSFDRSGVGVRGSGTVFSSLVVPNRGRLCKGINCVGLQSKKKGTAIEETYVFKGTTMHKPAANERKQIPKTKQPGQASKQATKQANHQPTNQVIK